MLTFRNAQISALKLISSLSTISFRTKLSIACSGIGKSNKTLQSVVWRASEGLVVKYGDDACFISKYKNSVTFGVADGVGGWRSKGIDPSMFSHSLVKQFAALCSDGMYDVSKETPMKVIVQGLFNVRQNCPKARGTSTVCVLTYDDERELMHTANFGDSGFMIIRNHKVYYKSRELQYRFNMPFQIGIISDDGDVLDDDLWLTDRETFPLVHNDVVVVGTDGLWDNMSLTEIAAFFSTVNVTDLNKTVDNIVLACRELSLDDAHVSPFALKLGSVLGRNLTGGKKDDITLIVAVHTGDPDDIETEVGFERVFAQK